MLGGFLLDNNGTLGYNIDETILKIWPQTKTRTYYR